MRTHIFGLTLQESLFLGFCSLLVLATKLMLRLHLKIPGHAMFFLVLCLLLAALCVRKPWSATITAVLAGCFGMALGVGKVGPLFVLGFVLPALVIDLAVPLLRKFPRQYMLFGLVGALAASTKFFITLSTDWLVGMDMEVLLLGAAIKTGGGVLFGGLGALPVPVIVRKLEARGLISSFSTTN
jgi:hypothetical protein